MEKNGGKIEYLQSGGGSSTATKPFYSGTSFGEFVSHLDPCRDINGDLAVGLLLMNELQRYVTRPQLTQQPPQMSPGTTICGRGLTDGLHLALTAGKAAAVAVRLISDGQPQWPLYTCSTFLIVALVVVSVA